MQREEKGVFRARPRRSLLSFPLGLGLVLAFPAIAMWLVWAVKG